MDWNAIGAQALAIGGWSLFGLAIVVGILLDCLGLFGNWIILAALGGLWAAAGFAHFGPWVLGGFLALATLGEVLEALAAGYGAKRFGGSKGSAAAALIGCLAGAVLGSPLMPVVGTLLGAVAGAFAGAVLHEHLNHEKPWKRAMVTGAGAALGRVGGLVAKLACGIAMLALAWWGY